jgi:hypothetical protein
MRFDVKAVVEAEDLLDIEIALDDAPCVEVIESEIAAQEYRELTRPVRIALARQILVVATPGQADDWAAYIGVVPGKNHDDEEASVIETGSKLRECIATAMFPALDPKKYRQ